MDEPESPSPTDSQPGADLDVDLPPGNHPLEIAARNGIGPLSSRGREVWHGQARPCVTCGQLVLRDAAECGQCGQDLSPEMLEKMRVHAGPWYVLEHVRPFPGVSLERIIRQIHRGLITETSIVRGPSTDYQWRFAVETPGLCRCFERCWNCHENVSRSDAYCRYCLSYLTFERPQASPAASSPPAQAPAGATSPGKTVRQTSPADTVTRASSAKTADSGAVGTAGGTRPARGGVSIEPSSHAAPAGPAPTPAAELRELSAAVGKSELPAHDKLWDEPPRIGGVRAIWVAAALLVIVIVALIMLTSNRSENMSAPPTTTPRCSTQVAVRLGRRARKVARTGQSHAFVASPSRSFAGRAGHCASG